MDSSIIFGLGPSGLFLGRELSKAGSNVIGIGRHNDIGLYSKHIKGYIADTKDDVVNIIDGICKKANKMPKAYICSDQYLTMILQECPEIFKKLDFSGIERETFELINSKKKLSSYCEQNGIRIPKTYTYNEVIEDRSTKLPLIFKLEKKELTNVNNPIGKTKVVNSQKELNELVLKIRNSSISENEIIVQSYIPGDNACQYSFGGYFQDGLELAGIVVNQLRQYPQGVSSYVLETPNKSIEKGIRNHVLSFVKPLGYTGFLEMEFKINKHQLYLMDVNPRPWGWVSILGKKYYNFHQLFSYNKNVQLLKNNEITMWKSPVRDIAALINNPLNVKKIKHKSEAKYLRKNRAYDVFDIRDIKPTFALLIVIYRKKTGQTNDAIKK